MEKIDPWNSFSSPCSEWLAADRLLRADIVLDFGLVQVKQNMNLNDLLYNLTCPTDPKLVILCKMTKHFI